MDDIHVSLEIGKLLMQLGFDEPCKKAYFKYGDDVIERTEGDWFIYGKNHYFKNSDEHFHMKSANSKSGDGSQCTAPTQQQVIYWLLNVHHIWINSTPVFQFNEGRKDYSKLKGWSYWITVMDKDGKYVENEELRLGNSDIFNSPEESINGGIIVVLNYLIKNG